MINIIAAIGAHRELGKNNTLLWDIPEDLKHFKEITEGHPIIMGRKTFESIGRILPNRTNIMLTRQENPADAHTYPPGLVIQQSLEDALSFAYSIDQKEVFVIGGAEVYKQALPYSDRLYLTIVDETFDADAFFPAYEDDFIKTSSRASRNTKYSYSFTTFKRRHKSS